MAKTHHRPRHRRANRTRRGGVKSASDKAAEKWAKNLLSPKGKAGIAKPPKSYAKPNPAAGDTSRPARDGSRVGD